jgi:hypothetical protein
LAAADALRIQVHVLDASTDDEFNMAFAALANARAGGLVIAIDASFDSQRDKLVALSSEHRIATIYGSRLNVVAGGLISYGPSFTDLYYRAGVYSGRVLKGEKPANLPVQQPTKFELVINLKTAKALGITIPEKLLAVADEVIERARPPVRWRDWPRSHSVATRRRDPIVDRRDHPVPIVDKVARNDRGHHSSAGVYGNGRRAAVDRAGDAQTLFVGQPAVGHTLAPDMTND